MFVFYIVTIFKNLSAIQYKNKTKQNEIKTSPALPFDKGNMELH